MDDEVLCSGCNVSLMGEEFLFHMEKFHVGPPSFDTSIRVECGTCCFMTTLRRIDAMVKHCLFEGHKMGQVAPETWELVCAQEEARIAAIGKMTGVDRTVETIQRPPESRPPKKKRKSIQSTSGSIPKKLDDAYSGSDREDGREDRDVCGKESMELEEGDMGPWLESPTPEDTKTELISIDPAKDPSIRRRKSYLNRKKVLKCKLCNKEITGVASMRGYALAHALTHERTLMPLKCTQPRCDFRTTFMKDLKKHCSNSRSLINGCSPQPLTETDNETREDILRLSKAAFPDLDWEEVMAPGKAILQFRFSK